MDPWIELEWICQSPNLLEFHWNGSMTRWEKANSQYSYKLERAWKSHSFVYNEIIFAFVLTGIGPWELCSKHLYLNSNLDTFFDGTTTSSNDFFLLYWIWIVIVLWDRFKGLEMYWNCIGLPKKSYELYWLAQQIIWLVLKLNGQNQIIGELNLNCIDCKMHVLANPVAYRPDTE